MIQNNMKYLLLLLFIWINFLAYGQASVRINDPYREIRFINLSDKENESFNRQNREVVKLIVNGIWQMEIQPFFIDYLKDAKAEKISGERFYKQMHYTSPLDITQKAQYLEPYSFTMIGLDQTVETVDGHEYCQVNYVNFYTYDSFSNQFNYGGKFDPFPYIFSVRWEDFIKVLDGYEELLYTKNGHGCWWRGNVLLTNRIDKNDYICKDFIDLAQKGCWYTVGYNNKKPIELADFRISNYEDYKNGFFNFFWLYQSGNKAPQPLLEINQDYYKTPKNDTVSFKWKDFLKMARDSSWNKSSDVCTIAEAFRLQKFSYDTSIHRLLEPKIISKSGKFSSGIQDPLCSSEVNPSFILKAPRKVLTKFSLSVYETLYLGEPVNSHLHRPGHSIVEIIMENINNGNLFVWKNDSLNTKLTIDEFNRNLMMYKEYRTYNEYEDFNKGDTIYNPYDYYLYNSIYFVANEFIPSGKLVPESLYLKKFTPVQLPLYAPQQLTNLNLVYTLKFDKEGNNITYTPYAIGISIPSEFLVGESSSRQIGYVYWEEFKKLLLTNSRATITYNEKTVNIVELMESRSFFPNFVYTGNLYAEE
jgi:hypothetical protein